MRRIESQREQWPHRVSELRLGAPESGGSQGTTFTDSTSTSGAETALAAGTAEGIGGMGNWTAKGIGESAAGNKYEFGGSGQGSTNAKGQPAHSWDCSGFAGDLYNAYTGKPTEGGELKDSKGDRFNTTSDMRAMGFEPGYKPGEFNIGVNPSPGAAGHMVSETADGTKAESSGRDGVEFGSGARSVNDPMFSQQWHLPGSGEAHASDVNAIGNAMTMTSRRYAVPEHPSRRYLDKLMEHIEENGWGGMTIKHEPGDGPKSGYMVSLKGTENKIPLDELSGKSLMEFMQKWHQTINADPENYMGGWQQGRQWYNDVSHRHDRDKGLLPAAKDAFQNKQLALYDVDNDRSIDTDEAGWMTGAPWIVGNLHD